MDSRTLTPLERELAEHSGWVRALARKLVRDDGEADDLAQEAWLAALKKPPRPGTAWRPWLATVVRTLALRRWRRPRAAELAAEVPAAGTSSPAEVFERLEAERILIEELQSLTDAQRRVLVMRYFDGLDAREIGERIGEPHGTVRWRLSEGLAALRKRLDARYGGDRPSWCRALALSFGGGGGVVSLPHTTPPAHAPHPSTYAVPALSLPFGALLVNSAVKIAIAVVALVSVSTGLYLWIEDPPPAPASEVASADPTPAAPAQIERGAELFEPRAEETASVSRSALLAVETPAVAAPASRGPARIEARALDALLAPIATARLSLADDAEQVAKSRGDGSLVLELPPREGEADFEFEVAAPGFAARVLRGRLRPDATLFLGDVILAAAGSIRGRVVDSQGRGLAEVEVFAAGVEANGSFGGNDLEVLRERGPAQRERSMPKTRSGSTGDFKLQDVEAGVVRLWARGADQRWNLSEPIDVRPREETDGALLTVRSAAEQDPDLAPIEGIVVDDHGEPVPKASIQVMFRTENFSRSWGQQAGDDGRFRIVVQEKSLHDLSFTDPARRMLGVLLPGVKPGTKDLRVELGAAKLVTLRVHDGAHPIERFTVHAVSTDGSQNGAAVEGDTHPDGVVTLQVPRYAFKYVVASTGYWKKELGPFDAGRVPDTLEADLEPSPGVHGRVLAEGQPVAGVRVRLHEKPRSMRIEVNNYRATIIPQARAEASTDEHGEFILDLAADGRYVLLADKDGFARAELGPLDLQAAQGSLGNEIVLGAGGSIEGRVRMPPGLKVEGVIVAVNRGDAAPRTQVVGPGGEFRFEHLTPGPWEVRRVKEEFRGANSTGMSSGDGITEVEIDESCRVRDGETTRHDLDLSAWRPAVLVAELRVGGEPARAWSLSLWPSGESSVTGELPRGVTDAEGRVRIETDDARSWDLTVQPPPESGSEYSARFPAVALSGGDNPWKENLVLGRIEGRVQGEVGAGLRYSCKGSTGGASQLLVKPDAEGRFVLPYVPVGAGSFERASADGKKKSWTKLADLEVAAGQTAHVELH